MVNSREQQVIHEYEKKGYKPVRCGSPDFIFIKTKDKKIIDFIFVEVKSSIDKLKPEQHIWKKILKDILHCKYSVKIIN